MARNEEEAIIPDADDVPFDPWENDEDETDRRRDPLRQPSGLRNAADGDEEPTV